MKPCQHVWRGRHHSIAAKQKFGALRLDACRGNVVRRQGQLNVADNRPILLGQTGEIERRGAPAFQMSRHGEDSADGDDPGPADPCHKYPTVLQQLGRRCCGRRQRKLPLGFQTLQRARLHRALPLPLDGHEAGAVTLHAGHILVARRLVDSALAAKLRLQRLDGDTTGACRAVSTALTHGRMDNDVPLGRCQRTALAPASLLGGTRLVIDDGGDAAVFTQALLNDIKFAAVHHSHTGGHLVRRAIPRGFLRNHHDLSHPFGHELCGDLRYCQAPFGRLPAGHRDRIIEEDLVGHGGPSRHGLPDCQAARMLVGPVAQVNEQMWHGGEARKTDPLDALATHLTEGCGSLALPQRHDVASDAGRSIRTVWQARGAVMRAAGTEERLAR
ncbi:hypothetical protein D9M70_435540 [compost metagenome]